MARLASLLVGSLVLGALLFRAGSTTSEARGVQRTLTTGGRAQVDVETVLGDLDTVWDMIWAPDGSMWFSERGGRISRLDLAERTRTVLGEVPNVLERGEAGLMGIALHPDFPDVPMVYAAHSYDTGGGIGNRLVRMRFQSGSLGAPEVLLDGLAGRGNHGGSRIVFGPDGFLYMTMGDAGNRPLLTGPHVPQRKDSQSHGGGGAGPGEPVRRPHLEPGPPEPAGSRLPPEREALFRRARRGG